MADITFEPWIGPQYGQSANGKLLILGESHYTGDEIYRESTDFTTKVVKDFLSGKNNIAFFRNMTALLNEGRPDEVWKNLAFANAIQVGMTDARSQPSREDIATVIPAFWALLEKLAPDKVLICSQRMWEGWLPDDDSRSMLVGHLEEKQLRSNLWKYHYSSGACYAIGIHHPSRSFNAQRWRPLVLRFLEGQFGLTDIEVLDLINQQLAHVPYLGSDMGDHIRVSIDHTGDVSRILYRFTSPLKEQPGVKEAVKEALTKVARRVNMPVEAEY